MGKPFRQEEEQGLDGLRELTGLEPLNTQLLANMRSSERSPRFSSHRWSILDDPIQNISEIIMHLILFLQIRTLRILQKS